MRTGRPSTFNTIVQISIPGVSEHEVDAIVHYVVFPGSAATYDDPGSDPEVSFEGLTLVPAKGPKIVANWLMPALLDGNEVMIADALADWRDDQIAAAEYRAEMRREDRLMEEF